MKKGDIVKIKSGTYPGEPEVHRTGRVTRTHIGVSENCLVKIVDKHYENDTFWVTRVQGEITTFKRKRSAGWRFNRNFKVHQDNLEKLNASLEDFSLLGKDVVFHTGECWVHDEAQDISLEHLEKGEVVYNFWRHKTSGIGKGTYAPLIQDRYHLVTIMKEIAKRTGAKLEEKNINEFIREDEDYLYLREISRMEFTDGSFGQITMVVKDAEKKALSEKLMEVIKQFDPAATLISDFKEDNYCLDSADIHVRALNMGINIEELLEQKKGSITGMKYGL